MIGFFRPSHKCYCLQIGFTGSKPAGQIVMKAAAETLKECTLELGGKSPLIICEDADWDQVCDDYVAVVHIYTC